MIYVQGLELHDNLVKSCAGICTSLLDVPFTSPSGMICLVTLLSTHLY